MADHIEAIRSLDPVTAQALSTCLVDFLLDHADEKLNHPTLPEELVTHFHIMIGYADSVAQGLLK